MRHKPNRFPTFSNYARSTAKINTKHSCKNTTVSTPQREHLHFGRPVKLKQYFETQQEFFLALISKEKRGQRSAAEVTGCLPHGCHLCRRTGQRVTESGLQHSPAGFFSPPLAKISQISAVNLINRKIKGKL